jgi:flagellar motor switch protein FliM
MADDVLSQAELETLLSSDTSRVKRKPAARAADGPISTSTPADLRRATPATAEQLSALASLHGEFTRRLGSQLSTMLRTSVEVKLASLDVRTFGDFLRGLESPTYLSVLRAAPLAGELLIDVPLGLLFPMIDRLLGGGGQSGPIDRRPLTDIELRLAVRVQSLVVAELQTAWRQIADVQLCVERVAGEPVAAHIVPPVEAIVRLAFEVTLPQGAGIVSLCLSGAAMRSMAGHLSDRPGARNATNARPATVGLVVHLAETKISPADLANLSAGDIIATEKRVDSPLVVRIDGSPKFHATGGTFEGRKAVQIDRPLDEPPQGGS